jgi:hypothetical protein
VREFYLRDAKEWVIKPNQNILGTHSTPSKILDEYRKKNSRNHKELQGTPRNPKEPQRTSRNPEEPRGTPRNPKEPQGTLRNPKQSKNYSFYNIKS